MTESEKPVVSAEVLGKYLQDLGIAQGKKEEMLKNRRIRSTLEALAGGEAGSGTPGLPGMESLLPAQKKLVLRAVEMCPFPDAAPKYLKLIKKGCIRNETDIMNARSVLEYLPEASTDEISTKMRENVPETPEAKSIVEQVARTCAPNSRARLIKEVKHHPRLRFVQPLDLVALVDALDPVSPLEKNDQNDQVWKLDAEKISQMLDMASKSPPPTAHINRMYRGCTVPPSLRKSRDKKWARYAEGEMQEMHTPFTNFQKSHSILAEHIERTGAKVRVRFPPEPNGHLHIGHAKAMSVNFGYRDYFQGWISLRYDDTNPKAEQNIYYEKILEMAKWLGYTPDAVTHASDYFPRLYDCAIQLIKKGLAYVCHQTREESAEKKKEVMNSRLSNGQKPEDQAVSPWRNRSIEENLREFEKMRRGEYDPGDAVLRMKMDMSSHNPQMWDLVAYRVVKHQHPKTGNQWIIYPSYDFTHCLCDSFEDITHSFCTTEFINARESYNWLCDALDLYRPVQWEYSRLAISGVLLSKRYISKSIENGDFSGWDDPGLYTLEGLRNRGVPPESIRRFVEALGITTASSEVPLHFFESIVREDLAGSPKVPAVLRPRVLRVLADASIREGKEERKMITDKDMLVLIDSRDYRDGEHDPSFFRLQKNGAVQLRDIGAVEFLEEKNGEVIARKTPRKHSAVIQWLPLDAPEICVEIVRGQERENYTGARVGSGAASAEPGSYWQFLRAGFFVCLPNSGFRLVVPLKAAPLL